MKPAYRRSLQRVTDYIYAHLEEELDLDKLAEVACLSPYHWHRVYAAAQGETVMATVKRLRLQRAADRLANSSLAVKEVARLAAYGSVEAFTRAFKQAYGLAPAAYRAGGSHAQYKQAQAAGDARGFAVELVQRPAMCCAAVAHRGSYLEIDRAMGQLFEHMHQQQLMHEDVVMMATFFDDPDLVAEDQLNAMACAPLRPQPQGSQLQPPLQRLELPPACCVRLAYQGPYADMRGAYRWLYGVWLPQSDFVPGASAAVEEYLNSPVEVAPAELLTHIYVPVVKADAGANTQAAL